MHYEYAIFVKFLGIAKQFSSNLANENSNISYSDQILVFKAIKNHFEFES